MVDGAVARARRDFGAQPQLQGELLGELGRMYMRLGCGRSRGAGAGRIDRGAREARAARRCGAQQGARLPGHALLQTSDDLPRIRALATQAREACAEQTVECAKARAYAATILSQLASSRATTRRAGRDAAQCQDTELAFGADA